MEKFCRKGHPARFGRRWLTPLMSLCLIGTMIPISARAENGSQATGLCEHHTEHTAECGYVAPVEGHACGHVHDDKCGYVESLEGSPCTFVCDICKNEAEPEEINLSAEMMSISGFNFSLTGNNGATVKTINLNAAALRPDSTWMSGGNLVYFGTYNNNPVAYRVLSSPNTQASSENYLLLDCDTILATMAFDDENTKNSGQTTFPNEWKGSDLEAWLNGTEFYAGSVFSGMEKTAIANTTLAAQSGYTAGDYGYSYKDYSATNHVF